MLAFAWFLRLILLVEIVELVEAAPWPSAGRAVDFDQEPLTLRVNCSQEVRRCLPQGLLPFEGACYAALSNASCGAGEWLALDAAAAAAGLLRGACVPRRPCASPQRLRMRATGRCHSEQQVHRVLCPGAALFYAPTGDVVCSRDHHGAADAALTVVAECDHLEAGGGPKDEEVHQNANTTTIEVVIQGHVEFVVGDDPGSECGRDDDGNCSPPVTRDEAISQITNNTAREQLFLVETAATSIPPTDVECPRPDGGTCSPPVNGGG